MGKVTHSGDIMALTCPFSPPASRGWGQGRCTICAWEIGPEQGSPGLDWCPPSWSLVKAHLGHEPQAEARLSL